MFKIGRVGSAAIGTEMSRGGALWKISDLDIQSLGFTKPANPQSPL